MRVTMVLPALTEATSPLFRPIKYSLFPPLGLATLAGYLPPDTEVTLHDEHVRPLALDDDTPDLAVIQVYITNASRAYALADATQGAIKPGDLLTTSGTPGHVMRASDSGRRSGAVLGKAMTSLKDGKGLVLVLVGLQ